MLTGNNITVLYEELLTKTLNEGADVSPRNYLTKELHPFLICLNDAKASMLSLKHRNLNVGFQCAEALWILSGSDEKWIFAFNENLLRYTNDGILKGAYGPRIRKWYGNDQLRLVLDRIREDKDTRQATVTIFDPAKDYKDHKDIPCTNMFRFAIREDKLDMITVMRSQDLWLGFPYDIFTFTLLHELMAGFIKVKPGKYFHFVDSLHIYESDFTKAKYLLENNDSTPTFEFSPQLRDIDELDKMLAYIKTNAIFNSSLANLQKIDNIWWRDFALCILSYKLWKTSLKVEALEVASLLQDQGFKVNMNQWYDFLQRKGNNVNAVHTG